jgi:integrase/recombinase XerD
MNALRQAAQEHLTMRRSLGCKLQEAGKRLLDFITFMEQHRASYITQSLALA